MEHNAISRTQNWLS